MRGAVAGLMLALVAAAAQPAFAQDPAPKTLAESRNNVGIAYDPLSAADFDGAGAAFSSVALEQAGVTPGAPVDADGMGFVWPDTASGEADNVEARGQSIAISGAQGATRLGLLAAAHDADVNATLTLTYVDALGVTSVETATVAVGDWLGDGHDVSSDFHVIESAVPMPMPAGLDAVGVPLDPARTLVSVGLPDDPRLHVFDLSLRPAAGGGGEEPPPALPVTATVAALPVGNVTGFGPPTVTLVQGQSLDFANLDPTGPHDLISEKRGPDFKRLFTSASIPFGQSTDVVGVEKLVPGTYAFVCSIHGTMRGELVVQAGE